MMHDDHRGTDLAASCGTLPNPKAHRYAGRQMVERARQLGARLKARLLWMKQFLHGPR